MRLQIVGTVFLYDGDLISSGLEMEPTRLIYQFLSEHLFGEPARPQEVAPKRSGGLLGGFGMDASSPRDTPRESGMDIGGTGAFSHHGCAIFLCCDIIAAGSFFFFGASMLRQSSSLCDIIVASLLLIHSSSLLQRRGGGMRLV